MRNSKNFLSLMHTKIVFFHKFVKYLLNTKTWRWWKKRNILSNDQRRIAFYENISRLRSKETRTKLNASSLKCLFNYNSNEALERDWNLIWENLREFPTFSESKRVREKWMRVWKWRKKHIKMQQWKKTNDFWALTWILVKLVFSLNLSSYVCESLIYSCSVFNAIWIDESDLKWKIS